MCKFTPLGFETSDRRGVIIALKCVNLPRWGLKLQYIGSKDRNGVKCKFTPLGFETSQEQLDAR